MTQNYQQNKFHTLQYFGYHSNMPNLYDDPTKANSSDFYEHTWCVAGPLKYLTLPWLPSYVHQLAQVEINTICWLSRQFQVES